MSPEGGAAAPLRSEGDRVDITVVVTGHREGALIAQAIRSARRAVEVASAAGCRCEIFLVLDRSDADTRQVGEAELRSEGRILAVDFGDPSKARNAAVQNASGRAIALLDGDDLFGSTWLAAGFKRLEEHGFGDVCVHPEYTVLFGEERAVWHHIGVEHPDFRPEMLMFENFFTALSLAPTALHRRFPFRPSLPARGFSHEDWAWIRETTYAGVRHVVASQTLHAVRRRRSSRLVEARLHKYLTIPTPLFSGRQVEIAQPAD